MTTNRSTRGCHAQTKKRSHDGKTVFATRRDAQGSLNHSNRLNCTDPGQANVYACTYGERDGKQHWHWGHSLGNQMKMR